MSYTVRAPETMKEFLGYAGLGDPSTRMLVGALMAGTIGYSLRQPKMFFREDGSLKPFKLVEEAPDATMYHFLMVPVAGALAFGVFI